MIRQKTYMSLVVRLAVNGYTVHAGEDGSRCLPGEVYVARTDEELDEIVLNLLAEMK